MSAARSLLRAVVPRTRPGSSCLASFLVPCLQQAQQQRSVSILASLSNNPASYKARKRRGRGPSSGLGKTSGRGHKGQKQHGKVPARFQGGQTPIEIVKGKRGFENVFSVEMTPLSLGKLQEWIDAGRIDASRPITMKELVDSRCLHGVEDGVKALATQGETLKTPINLLVSRASATAIHAIERAGGTVMTRYYTPSSIRRILRGECDAGAGTLTQSTTATPAPASPTSAAPGALSKPFLYRLPDPTSRKDIEYYRDPAHRGYLTHLVPEGEGPSLFYKTPRRAVDKRKATEVAGPAGAPSTAKENRLW